MFYEATKYESEIYKILGIALFAPLGRLFFDVVFLDKSYEGTKLLELIITSLALFVLGFVFIKEGRDILKTGEK